MDAPRSQLDPTIFAASCSPRSNRARVRSKLSPRSRGSSTDRKRDTGWPARDMSGRRPGSPSTDMVRRFCGYLKPSPRFLTTIPAMPRAEIRGLEAPDAELEAALRARLDDVEQALQKA